MVIKSELSCPRCGHYAHRKYACKGGMGDYCDCSHETNEFERWVLANFIGVEMTEPPADWDQANESFYLIEGKQYRIPHIDVPPKFIVPQKPKK